MKSERKPGRQPPAIFQQSRRLRRPRSAETDRIRSLLNRLQRIVPAAPNDRQLPQVQVIQHVINYICQLQDQVVRHPRLGKAAQKKDEGKSEVKAPVEAEGEAGSAVSEAAPVPGQEAMEQDSTSSPPSVTRESPTP